MGSSSVTEGQGEQVRLTMPATPQLLRVARLTAAGLASRLGFSFDQVEDLKIAVDELSTYLIGSHGRHSPLEVRFDVHADRIEISGRSGFSPEDRIRTSLTELSRMILKTVVDTAALDHRDGVQTFELVKAKRA